MQIFDLLFNNMSIKTRCRSKHTMSSLYQASNLAPIHTRAKSLKKGKNFHKTCLVTILLPYHRFTPTKAVIHAGKHTTSQSDTGSGDKAWLPLVCHYDGDLSFVNEQH